LINIGILGTANIAIRSVIPAMVSLPEYFKVYGIASRTLEKAEKTSSEFGCKAFDGYEALLADDCIQAVYIPLPTGLHFEWVTKSLQAGKHVLCEKSLGCSLKETQEMVELAESNGLSLVENFQFRFHSQLAKLKMLVESGKIGDVRSLRCSFGFPPFHDKENIRYNKKLGGGALLDAGAYMMKISTILIGDEDLNVNSAVWHVDEALDVDLHGTGFLINSKNGLTSHIAFGFDHFYQCGVEVWGSKGKFRTNRLFTARADYKPLFVLETNSGVEQLELDVDDHFRNMLLFFHKTCQPKESNLRRQEYKHNITQARLIEQFRNLAHAN